MITVKKKNLFNLIILIFGLLLIVNLSRSLKELLKAGNRVAETRKRVENLQQQNQDLQKKLQEVESPEYLEKVARDKLGLAKEGETVVILPPIEPEATKAGTENNLSNWQKWWKLFF